MSARARRRSLEKAAEFLTAHPDASAIFIIRTEFNDDKESGVGVDAKASAPIGVAKVGGGFAWTRAVHELNTGEMALIISRPSAIAVDVAKEALAGGATIEQLLPLIMPGIHAAEESDIDAKLYAEAKDAVDGGQSLNEFFRSRVEAMAIDKPGGLSEALRAGDAFLSINEIKGEGNGTT